MIVESYEDVIILSGALRSNFWETIHTAISLTLKRHPTGVIIDCSGITEITPDGAETFHDAIDFVAAHKRARIVVAAVSEEMLEVLRSVPEVRSQLPIAETVEAARKSLDLLVENDDDELGVAAASAKISASDAFENMVIEMIQMHGGVGYTWEYDCHLFYRRAKVLAHTLGRGRATKSVGLAYRRLCEELGGEVRVLTLARFDDLERAGGEALAMAVTKVRDGQVRIVPGFDGQYGTVLPAG